jgi:hypothetical protein
MKISKLVTFAAAVMVLSARMGMAQVVHVWEDPNQWWGTHFTYGPAVPEKFTANEFSTDIFASFTAAQTKIGELFETDIGDGKWGGGLGANYFLTREIGIGIDANAPDNRGHFVDLISGSLIARLPFESTGLAPYVFGGGGRLTEPRWEWTGHAGLGLEFRINPVTGIFADGRYVWADKTTDQLLLRGGLRLIF